MRLRCKMKKIVLLTIVSCLVMSNQVKATGVPVVDVGSIAQAVIQVQEAKKRYETLKQQFQASTGNAQLGVLLNDDNVRNAINKSTQSIGSIQSVNDSLANSKALMSTLDLRTKKIDQLINQINSTTDLSSKADLANTLSGQQAMVNAEMNKMAVLMKQMDQQEKVAEQQASKTYWENRRK